MTSKSRCRTWAAVFIATVAFGMGSLRSASAEQPASKATAQVGEIAIIESEGMEYTTILSNEIKTPNGKDLFIDVSLECGLYTATKVDSLGGIEDRAEAEAGVEVMVLVDGEPALPGPINFCKRTQVLIAEFQGLLEDEEGNLCIVEDPQNPGTDIIDEACLRPETLELILDTMSANSFNFVKSDLSSGTHLVEVVAKIDTFIESTLDSGTKVKDGDADGEGFDPGDTLLTVERGGKFEVGQTIVIDEEQLLITAIDDKDMTVIRAVNGTAEDYHATKTRIYIVAGAEATASIGHGTVTVELVRMIKDEEIILE